MVRPMLDVSEVLLDPEFSDSILVIRRPEVIVNGRSTVPSPMKFHGIIAVVTSASPNDLNRLPDSDRASRWISVICKFPLQLSSPGYKPDYVVWGGDQFIVAHMDPYKRYGAGFVQTLCASMDYQDQPPSNPDEFIGDNC